MNGMMNVGMIGAGVIAKVHATALELLPELAEVKAVCDIDVEAAQEVAGQFNAAVYANHQEMLEKEDLDIVLVGLPHFLHLPVGMDVLNKGINLFMEKPLANTVEECEQLIAAAKENHKSLFVGQSHQYCSVLLKAKELITSGAIGEPRMIYDEIVAYYCWETRQPWGLDPVKAGGGSLFNTSPHQVDHLLFLIDSPITKLKANVAALRPDHNIDSDTIAFIEYENGVQGVMAVFTGTKIMDGVSLTIRVLGTEGSIQFNPLGNEIRLSKMDTAEVIQADPDLNPAVGEWRECISAIKENRAPITDGTYGRNVVAVLETMVKSSKTRSELTTDWA